MKTVNVIGIILFLGISAMANAYDISGLTQDVNGQRNTNGNGEKIIFTSPASNNNQVDCQKNFDAIVDALNKTNKIIVGKQRCTASTAPWIGTISFFE